MISPAEGDLDPSEFDIRLLDSSECVSWQPPPVSAVSTPSPVSQEKPDRSVEEARQRGLAEGRASGEAEYRQLNEELAILVSSLAKPLAQIDEYIERELTELALMIGQQLCQQQLLVEPNQLLHIVHDAIARLPIANSPVRISVHPDDAALIAASGELEPSWQLHEDPTLARGGCEIHTDSSRVDATLETRLAQLIKPLFDAHDEGHPDI